MAGNTSPYFVETPVCAMVIVSGANALRDGTGLLHTALTAGNNGTRVDCIRAQASGTIAAGVVRVFLSDGGGTNHLFKEFLTTATNPSTTVEAFSYDWTPPGPLVLPSGYQLKFSTNNNEQFRCFVIGGSF